MYIMLKAALKFIWKYFIPLIVAAVGVRTLFIDDRSQPILKSVPIVPGDNQILIGLIFIGSGLIMGVIVHRYEKQRENKNSD